MLNNQKGFTLIELMVVVVIIGILAAIALPNFLSMQDRAKESEVKANVHTVQLVVEDYKTQFSGTKPVGFLTAGVGIVATPPAAGNQGVVPATMKNPFVTPVLSGMAAVAIAPPGAIPSNTALQGPDPGAGQGQVGYDIGIVANGAPYVIVGIGKNNAAAQAKVVAITLEGQ